MFKVLYFVSENSYDMNCVIFNRPLKVYMVKSETLDGKKL
jgi:hypothetical protein